MAEHTDADLPRWRVHPAPDASKLRADGDLYQEHHDSPSTPDPSDEPGETSGEDGPRWTAQVTFHQHEVPSGSSSLWKVALTEHGAPLGPSTLNVWTGSERMAESLVAQVNAAAARPTPLPEAPEPDGQRGVRVGDLGTLRGNSDGSWSAHRRGWTIGVADTWAEALDQLTSYRDPRPATPSAPPVAVDPEPTAVSLLRAVYSRSPETTEWADLNDAIADYLRGVTGVAVDPEAGAPDNNDPARWADEDERWAPLVELGRLVRADCHHGANTYCNHRVREYLGLLAERGYLAAPAAASGGDGEGTGNDG